MKTAEDWIRQEGMFRAAKYTSNTIINIIKQIQFDSWRQGMSDAARIAESNKGKAKTERKPLSYYSEESHQEILAEERGENIASEHINQAILQARDAKKSV